MSAAQALVLDTLRRQGRPSTLTELTAATGLHANTLREHIEALIELGLAERHRAEPRGRGRPAWLYRAADTPGEPESAYAGLVAALVRVIQQTSASPREDAVTAGIAWGRELAGRGRGAAGARTDRDRAAAPRRLVELLRRLGFEPDADLAQGVVRLTRCPLLETARRHPDVVCGVHLGVLRGALEEYGGDPAHTELVPFSEPGACRVLLDREGR